MSNDCRTGYTRRPRSGTCKAKFTVFSIFSKLNIAHTIEMIDNIELSFIKMISAINIGKYCKIKNTNIVNIVKLYIFSKIFNHSLF